MRFFQLIVLSLLLASSWSCSKKTMNDRDVRREQRRIDAHKKQQEMSHIPGDYRGVMTDSTARNQDVSLHIEIKDVPDMPQGEGGQVDPVLIPTVSGALNLTYGSGAGLESYSFGTTSTDFDSSSSHLTLVVSNTQLKDIKLSLEAMGEQLTGTWSSSSTSTSGNITLTRSPDLTIGGDAPELKGNYAGFVQWNQSAFYAQSQLTLSTAQDGVDNFHLTGNLRLAISSPVGDEIYQYEYQEVEFNPLTRQFSFKSEGADIYLIGQLTKSGIQGNWYSKRSGLLGPFSVSKTPILVPAGAQLSPGLSGVWYVTFTNASSATNLPENLMLSFNVIGGQALAGNVRFYLGNYQSSYQEFRFDGLDYRPFARTAVGVTVGTPKLTFKFDLSTGSLRGEVADAALGFVGTFVGSRQKPASQE